MYQIDNQSRKAVYEQIVEQIERYILTGIVKAEEQIPSVRAMSIDLNVNPNTVQRAYSELDRRGIIYTIFGKGSFVSNNAKELLQAEKRKNLISLKEPIKDLKISGIAKNEIFKLIEDVYHEEWEENND